MQNKSKNDELYWPFLATENNNAKLFLKYKTIHTGWHNNSEGYIDRS